jgi:hypothetical protein
MIICAQCGRFDGRIQHVDITWPKLDQYQAYPYGEPTDWPRSHVEAWLHPECEAAFARRIERERPIKAAIGGRN